MVLDARWRSAYAVQMSWQHLRISRFGGPEVLQMIEEPSIPEPGPGEVRIKVLAAGTGFTDTMIRRGRTKWLVVLSILFLCQGCSLSDHGVAKSSLGKASSLAEMEKLIDVPGPIEVETVNSADWTVPLSGLLDLKSAAAQAAHLTDHPEPIHVFVHIVRHPHFGTFLVDTGVSQRVLPVSMHD